MSLTMLLIPAALVQGIRQNRRGMILSSVGILAILAAGCAVMMEFITRPL